MLRSRIRRTDRRAFHELYRERFPRRPRDAEPARAEAASGPAFVPRLSRPLGLVIAGSAGERVQSAAAILCHAAVLSGLRCTQKNDYPVTVGSGFSLSEVKLSPEPILYTGIDQPEAMLVTSTDGLREVRGRGDLGRLAPGGAVIADGTVARELPGPETLALPLRRALSAPMAALGAIAVFVARTGILDRAALLEATRALVGQEPEAACRAVESAWSLASA